MAVKYVQCPDSKMLIYRHEKRRMRQKCDVVDSIINRNCHRNGHYVNDVKFYSYILIYVFIVATIMILSLPTTIAMKQNQIENNENVIIDVESIIQMEQSNGHHLKNIDKYYRPIDNESLNSIKMASSLSLSLKKEPTTGTENAERLRPTKKMIPIGMQIKHSKPAILLSKMLQITNGRHNNKHEIENRKMHDSKIKQKKEYAENVTINEIVQWQRDDDSIIRMQSTKMSGNRSKIPFKFATIQNVSQKSVKSIIQNGINENNANVNTTATTVTSATTTNLREHFYAANHQIMVKHISCNRTKRNNQDNENARNADNPNNFNYKLNVKREKRSVDMQPKQIQQPNGWHKKNARFSEAYHQQSTSLPKTKLPFYKKQTINEFFDLAKSEGGGATEINGPIFDANRTTVSIISNGNQGEREPFDYVNVLIENNNGAIKNAELRNDYDNDDVIISNQFISGQHVDVFETSNDFIGSTVPTPIRTTTMAQTSIIDMNGVSNSTAMDDENNKLATNSSTCVGDPLYCNLTEAEYHEMLYDYIFPTTGEWILIGFHGVVFTVGLVGNVLVCLAVYANATMRTITNIFIVNLAIADLLVIILCLPPTVVWDVTETWFLGEAMCKGVLYLQTVSVTVSVLTLTFISIDRWYAICFPLRYVSTNGRAWCSIALIWIAALLSDILEFINSTIEKKELRFDIDLFTQCVSTWDKDTEKNVYIARFGMLYVLPLFLMSVAYFKIICVLWRSDTIPGHRESCNQTHAINNTRTGTVGNTSTMSQLRARRKAAKMLVAVVIMFAICYFPVHCLNIIRYTVNIEQSEVITILSLISHWLCYANSAVNPLIYNFMSGKFRREFVSVLDRCRCGHHDIHSHHSFYLNAQAARLNTISPNTRSLYHYTSQRDRHKSFREKQTLQTSFVENVCDIYTGNIDENNQKYKVNANGKSHQPL